MSKAAHNLYVSQQALSKGIMSLEVALGSRLFERDATGATPTEFGMFFLERAQAVLDALDLAQNSLRDFSTRRRTIALGLPRDCLTDFGGTLSPDRLDVMQRSCPDVTFEFIEATPHAIEQGVADGTFQFGIGSSNDDVFDSVLLDMFPLGVLVDKRSPLAQKECITLYDLTQGRVALPFEDDRLAVWLKQLAARNGAHLEISPIKLAPVDGARLVTDERTFAVRPVQHAQRTLATPNVALLPLADDEGTPLRVSLSLFWLKSHPLEEAERALISYVSDLYENRNRA